MRTPRSVLAAALLVLVCAAVDARAWQDLAEPYVQGQLEKLVATQTPAGDKLRVTWTLVEAGRAALHPLGEVASKQPKLAWEAIRLMDLIRTDSEVPRRFSSFLDALPAGLRKVPGARASLQRRLEDMLGRRFASATERTSWLRANGDYLRYDPARFRFSVDEAARAARRPLVPTPPLASGREAADRAYASLILALHLGNVEIVRSLCGPRVALHRPSKRCLRVRTTSSNPSPMKTFATSATPGPPTSSQSSSARSTSSTERTWSVNGTPEVSGAMSESTTWKERGIASGSAPTSSAGSTVRTSPTSARAFAGSAISSSPRSRPTTAPPSPTRSAAYWSQEPGRQPRSRTRAPGRSSLKRSSISWSL